MSGRAPAVELRPVNRHNIDALLALGAGDGGQQVASNAKPMAHASVIAEPAPQLLAFYGSLGFVPTDDFVDGEGCSAWRWREPAAGLSNLVAPSNPDCGTALLVQAIEQAAAGGRFVTTDLARRPAALPHGRARSGRP